MNIYYSNNIESLLSSPDRNNENTKLFNWIGRKVGNIKDPFEFSFKKRFGYLPKNSIRCTNGDIYSDVVIIK